MKTTNRDKLAKQIRSLRAKRVSELTTAEYWRREATTLKAVYDMVCKDNQDKANRLAYINKVTIGPWLGRTQDIKC